jgi:Domain of unknown function (DUF5680)
MLLPFIVAAKQACYVGGGRAGRSCRLGSHDLIFQDGPWSYRDSYFGGTDFLGQETVWYRKSPVWAMNYCGWILRDDHLTAAQGARVIRSALTAMYKEGRFLGGFVHHLEDFAYSDTSEGDVTRFSGSETISAGGVVAYRLNYHGGRVRA